MKDIVRSQIVNVIVLFVATLLLAAVAMVVIPQETYAQPAKDAACEAIGGCDASAGTTLEGTVKTIIDILSAIVGIIAVIMIIVGGFKFVTSGGDSSATKSARDTILYAIVGLVIVAIAQAIVWFVLSRV